MLLLLRLPHQSEGTRQRCILSFLTFSIVHILVAVVVVVVVVVLSVSFSFVSTPAGVVFDNCACNPRHQETSLPAPKTYAILLASLDMLELESVFKLK